MNITDTVELSEGKISFSIYSCVAGCVLILLNSVSLYLLKTSKTIAPQIKTLVFNISLVDLQLGLVVLVSSFQFDATWIPNIGKLVKLSSHFFTMVISVDRMVSVSHPNYYLFHGTEERISKISRMLWLAYSSLALFLLICLSVEWTFIDLAMDIFTVILFSMISFCVTYSTVVIYKMDNFRLNR